MAKTFNINNADVVQLTNRLEKIHKSAMPVSVRGALNDAAFEHRTDAIGQFRENFTIRRDRFITSHMKVNKSKNTFNLREMVSESGIIKDKSRAGNELEKQEIGGFAFNRNVPTDEVRISQEKTNLVSKRFYFEKFKDKPLGHFPSQKGIKVKRRKKTTFIKKKDRLIAVSKGGEWETLYYIDRRVRVTKNAFIAPAEVRTSKKMFRLYKDRAKVQFKKLLFDI